MDTCAGIQRDDRFDSVSEFVGFMKDEAAQDAAVYAEHLWNLGFRNFGAISYAFQVDAVAMALLIDETDVAGSKSIPVRAFAGKHAGEPLSFFFPLSWSGRAEPAHMYQH